MIENWRSDWGQGDFPFYFVQIAPYRYGGNEYICPELQESQFMTLSKVPNTGMAVITDIGNVNDIHPRNKQDVGERLALWALAKDYGFDDIVYSGPLYKDMKIEDGIIRIYFDHAENGLTAKDGRLSEFMIAGDDKIFVPATAEIDGSSVVVYSDKVPDPVAVRFAWKNQAQASLFNKAGLPASPFRTDDFPAVTINNK